MVLGFTSKLTDDRIPRNFQRILKGHEIKSREIREGFPVSTEAEKLAGRKAYQVFTFLCIAAAVICGMIDYMMTGGLNWFWFAAAGCASAQLDARDRKGQSAGAGGVSVLSCTGIRGWMYSGTARLARIDTHRLSVGCLRRDQYSGARCAVHFSEERYLGGVPEEAADVSLSCTGHGMGTDESHK